MNYSMAIELEVEMKYKLCKILMLSVLISLLCFSLAGCRSNLNDKEQFALECVNDMKGRLLNPQAMQIHSIEFTKHDGSYYVCVVDYAGQNRMGGMNRDRYLYIDDKNKFSENYRFSDLLDMDLERDVVFVVYEILHNYVMGLSSLEQIDVDKIVKLLK